MMLLRYFAGVAGVALMLSANGVAFAHGFAGDRFFPATILNDDPFVADELSLPTFTRSPTGPDRDQEYELEFEYSKRVTPELGISIGYNWKYLKPKDAPAVTGFENFEVGLGYQLFKNAPHEATALVGLDAGFGHTGRVQALAAPDFTALSPVFAFGKGFGDLPETMPWLRPIAVTGNFSYDFPLKTHSADDWNPNFFNYGFSLQYSLEYLQHHVKDIGLSAPFDRMIALVEMSFSTGVNRGRGGQTTGTIQPGLIWAGQQVQVGAELILPINAASGRGFGGVVQLHFYLDDIFPKTIGRPLFGD